MATIFDGVLFTQSLQDLVKGIRAHRRDEADYIRGRISDITVECRSSEPHKKANGVLKLTYLHMLGYPVDFASFYILEVMSRTEFAYKRVGYLAAAQVFSPTTDVLLLTTNLFKKDITAGRLSDCSHALTCVAKVATAELATELAPDVVTLLASPRPYVRKKATLTLYSLVAASPDTLPAATVRLKDRLVDSDSAVVCAAVTVVAQLAARSPRPFLVLAPLLYRILTESHNNWLLIKVVKLFGVLAPLEPRLARKLAPPLTALMKSTKAKSLLYECCSTVTLALLGEAPLVALAADNLGQFIMDPDQNLKYLGLASMRRLAARFPSAVMPHRGLVLDCLDDADVGIRLRALDLVGALVNRGTFREVSDVLLDHLEAVAAVAGRAAVSGLAGSGGGTEEDGVMGGGAGRHALTAIDTDAPFREALATRLLDAGVFIRPTAPPAAAGRPRTAPRPSDALPKAPTEGAVGQSPVTGAAVPLSPVVEPASSAGVESAMSSISLADPVEDDAARNSTGGYLQLLTEDDFEWYVSEVLGGVARCSRCLSASVTRRAAAQLVELPARVPAARQSCVELALQLLRADGRGDRGGENDGAPVTVPASRSAAAGGKAGDNGASGESASSDGGDADRAGVGGSAGSAAAAADDSPVAAAASVAKATGSSATRATDASQASPALLAAAAWLIGEYASLVPRPAAAVVDALLGAVPTGGGARCVSAALKLYASVATSGAEGGEGTTGDAAALHQLLLAALPQLAASAVAEVQERSAVALALITAVPPGSANAGLLASLFGIPLLPVDSGAQARAAPAAAATAGVDLATPLLGCAERGRLIADADAAATVDAADRGLDGGRLAGGRRGVGEERSTRGAETASLLSVGLSGGSLGGTTSRTSGAKPRRPRGERHRGADEAATLIDVHGDGGDGSGRRRAAAAAAILGDVGYDPAGDGAAASASGAAAAPGVTDDLYGELDFGIGGAVARGAAPSASASSTRPPGRTGGGKAAKAPRRTKIKSRAAAAAPADGDGVGQLVDFDDAASAPTKKPVRKKKVAKGTRAAKKPPPAAESLI